MSASRVKHAHDKRTNENGKRLLDLVHEENLTITNTVFEKRKGKRWTFEDPKGNRYLLDYILVNSKWKNSILNSEVYSSFASVGSDHMDCDGQHSAFTSSYQTTINKKAV